MGAPRNSVKHIDNRKDGNDGVATSAATAGTSAAFTETPVESEAVVIKTDHCERNV